MSKKQTDTFPGRIILTTFAIGILLNIVNYPEWMAYVKPDWVLLVLFYWCLALPEKVAVGYGWVVGLILDILYYSVLGQHAVSKAFVAFIAVSAYRRIRLYNLWQQCIVVFFVASIDIGFTLWVVVLTSGAEVRLIYWQSALMSAFLWPVIYNVLRFLRHKTVLR